MRLDDYCRAVGRDCRLTTTDRVVLWTMSTYVNRQTGETFVSLATIAIDVCLHRDQVRRAVRHLEDYGVIAATARRVGRATVYRFPLHPTLASSPREFTRGQSSTTPRESTRRGHPQPRVNVVHTPREYDGNPACGHAPNHVSNHEKEPRDDQLDDDTPVAVPASVKDLLRPPPRMLYEAYQ